MENLENVENVSRETFEDAPKACNEELKGALESLYTIHDKTSGMFGAPMKYKNNNTAIRDLAHQLKMDEKSTIFAKDGDKELIKIAEFNPYTGRVIEIEHEFITNLASLVE